MSTTVNDVLSWFKDSKTAKQMEEERQATLEEQRRKLGAELVAVEREREKVLPPLKKKLEAAEQLAKQSAQAHRDAVSAAQKARYEVDGMSFQLDARQANAEKELRLIADPRIRETVDELLSYLNRIRTLAHSPQESMQNRVFEPRAAYHRDVATSNYESVKAHHVGVLQAIQELQRLEARYVEDVASEIQKIRDAIPKIQAPQPLTAAQAKAMGVQLVG